MDIRQATAPAPAAPPNATLPFEVRPSATGRGLFACEPIAKGTRLFAEDDWADEEERRAFSVLTPQQIADLAPAMRTTFVCYAYNIDHDKISGTFHPERVRHPVNFMNHSCDPNVGYRGTNSLVALSGIRPGQQLRMDYGTYSFSFDHEFTCSCGAPWCRGKVTRNDWPELVRAGLRLPNFMRGKTAEALWG